MAPPSRAQWAEVRPLVEYWYGEEGLTMRQVGDRLRSRGLHVSTRMIKTRVMNWNLSRNHRSPDMRTAIELLGPDRSKWPEPEPKFTIRGQIVRFHDVLLYFKRKGIKDPVSWARDNPDPEFKLSNHVSVLSATHGTCPTHVSTEPITPVSPPLPGSASQSATNRDLELLSRPARGGVKTAYSSSNGGLRSQPQDPLVYRRVLDSVREMRAYCLIYIASPRAVNHTEPEVHMKTVHGCFEDRMEDGIYCFAQRNYDRAFGSFDQGFSLIREMFMDDHPMSLALYMKVLCGLIQAGAQPVLENLIRYTLQAAEFVPGRPSAISKILGLTWSSEQRLQLTLINMRTAMEVLESAEPNSWKSLYVRERYCDSLYRGKIYGEATMRRAQLLMRQEAVYGGHARNVLWTYTSVAHEYLTSRRFEPAELHFGTALQRADHLTGFGRAKIRFAALEGLARLEKMKAEAMRPQLESGTNMMLTERSYLICLQKALSFLSDAAESAQVWFGTSSRRLTRVLDQRRKVESMVVNI